MTMKHQLEHLDVVWLLRVVTRAPGLLPGLAGQHAASLAGELSPDDLAALHVQAGPAVAPDTAVPARHGLQVLGLLDGKRWK